MMGYTPVFGGQVQFVLLGSKEISGETLLRWYVLHVLMLPFVIVIFMAVHFWQSPQGRRNLRTALGEKGGDSSMAEVPEHLLKRSRERRKALGLPVEGDDGDDERHCGDSRGRRRRSRTGGDRRRGRARGRRVRRRRGDHRGQGRVPAHLLERSRKRKAALAGGGGDAAPAAAGGGDAHGDRGRGAARRPRTGPGGHTQRLLTVVKSGSIQQTRAEAQDKVHVWPHLLVIEFASILSLMAFITVFSALVKAPLLGLADVNQTPNPSKAPWYFLGLQELLTMFNPMVAGVTHPGHRARVARDRAVHRQEPVAQADATASSRSR